MDGRRGWPQTAALILLSAAHCLTAQVPGYTITTMSGFAVTDEAVGIASDSLGNVYVADWNGAVRKVSPEGAITNFAGGGVASGGLVGDGGPATSANLSFPSGVAVDSAGNVYIADTGHNRIRKVSTSGTITTVAGPGSTNGTLGDGGPATSATLSVPASVAVDSNDNLYVADTGHNRIRMVSLDGTITTVAGNGSASGALGDGGPATSATLAAPIGVAVDTQGHVFIADSGHARIRQVRSGIISTLVGNGTTGYSGDGGLATLAAVGETLEYASSYYSPEGLALDGSGNIYIADNAHGRIRVVTSDGQINTIAGNGGNTSTGDNGPATNAGIARACGVALGAGGKVYVAGFDGVRVLTPTGASIYPGPSLEVNGVVNASAFGAAAQLALGSWVEIHGSYLAPDTRSWAGSDFSGINAPTSLDGTSVTIGGQPAFISYISAGQVNAQVPTNIGSGTQQLVVNTNYGKTAAYSIIVNGVLPRMLAPSSFNINSTQYAVALFSDGSTYVLPSGAIPGVPSRPAVPGDAITLYGIGFGSVAPDSPAGQVVQSNNALDLPFTAKIGALPATVMYSGLAPGTIGLYQFNIVVPKVVNSGPLPFTFTLGGVAGAQALYISIQ